MISAIEFGRKNHSCLIAMEWRKSLGPGATQADAWRACKRGDWLIWQLNQLPASAQKRVRPALHRAVERIIVRAIRRGQRSLRGVLAEWATEWRRWAKRWLSGEDRSASAARVAAGAADYAATRAAELLLQARDIRSEIPEWPGGES
jgi:hypothetical protein